MKSVLLACRMIEQEINVFLQEGDFPYPVYFIPPNLHSDPEKLREYLQNTIDSFTNVDRIILSVCQCGNGTVGLKATTAQLVLPRCSDCIDLLLSEESLSQLERPSKGCFFTESWVKYTKDESFSLEKLQEKYGEYEGKMLMRNMFYGYKYFYLIDTGFYDMSKVADEILPQAEVIDVDIKVIPGRCGTLRKMIGCDFDSDFLVIPKGGTISETDFRP